MRRDIFEIHHPSVPFVYFTACLGFCMFVMQPIYLAMTLVAAEIYGIALRGFRATAKAIVWQGPLLLFIGLLNPVFSAVGTTELFTVFGREIYLESFLYGLAMGVLLVATLQWFSNASQVLSSDKIMALFGNKAPIVSLMITMTGRLVPELVSRGELIGDVQKACTAAHSQQTVFDGDAGVLADYDEDASAIAHASAANEPGADRAATATGVLEVGFVSDDTTLANVATGPGTATKKKSPRKHLSERRERKRREKRKARAVLADYVRRISVLMGWSMEDSLETADAMRARGWGVADRRSTYQPYRFKGRDGLALTALIILLAINIPLAVLAASRWYFYPALAPLTWTWGFLFYGIMLAFPLWLRFFESTRWFR